VAKDKFCNKWSIGVCGNIVGQHFSELFSEHIYFKLGESGPPVAIFEELLKLLTNKDVHDAPRIAGLTMQFLLEMAGRAPKHLPVPLSDIIRIFEFNIGKPLELAQVAAELNITVSGMAALFRKHIGLTPKQYRQKLRLQRAEQLLRENSLPIKEIALRLGYQAPQHFTRDIRKFFGCSPRELRNGENQP